MTNQHLESKSDKPRRRKGERRARVTRRLRGYFLAGVLVTMPLAITFAVARWFILFVDSKIVPMIPETCNPDTYLRDHVGFEIGLPGLGVLVLIIAITITGALTAGFVGGKVNMSIMRVMDVFYAFPSVLLAIAISGALGAGIFNAIISLTIVFIPPIARVTESVTTQIRALDYVEAARASGAKSLTIIRVHIISNVAGPVFVYSTSLISVSIILSSGLSFLGLGTEPPQPEWGLMLNTLRQSIYVNPWVAALPGVMIFLTSLSFNMMSDGVRSAMDIKL